MIETIEKMPWIKSRPKPVNFEIFLIRIFEYLEMRFRNELPSIHRLLYRCPPDEFVLVRRLFSAICGYLICKLLLMVCLQSSVDDDAQFVHSWGLALMIIGFVQSVQIRTVICLFMPFLVITLNGIFFYIRLLTRAHQSLSTSILGSIRALWNMISCLINYRQMREKALGRLGARPLTQWLLDWSEKIHPLTSSKDVIMADRNITEVFESFVTKIKNFKSYCESSMESLKENDYCGNIMEELYAQSNAVSKVIFNQFYNACYKMMSEIGGKFCEEMNKPFEKLVNLSTNESSITTLVDSLKLIKSSENLDKMNDALEIWQSLIGYRMNLEEEFRNEFEWIRSVGIVFRTILIVSLIIGIMKAIVYHNKYLRFRNFDNHYIDRYFYRIDEKRKQMNKVHLLPLRGNDRWQLIPTFSLKSNRYEKAVFHKLQKKIIVITLMALAMIIYMDYILSDFVELLASKLSMSDHMDILVNKFHPNATGGVFATVVNNLVKKFHFNYTELFRHDWHTCRQTNTNQMNWSHYQNITIDAIILLAVNSLHIHFIRWRHLICDFFYYRFGKQRILCLYNQKLANRKRFLRLRLEQINKIVQSNRLFDKSLDPIHQYTIENDRKSLISRIVHWIWRKLFPQHKLCFICHSKIKRPFYYCSSTNCRLIYCEPCFNDFLLICLNCGVNGAPYVDI